MLHLELQMIHATFRYIIGNKCDADAQERQLAFVKQWLISPDREEVILASVIGLLP